MTSIDQGMRAKQRARSKPAEQGWGRRAGRGLSVAALCLLGAQLSACTMLGALSPNPETRMSAAAQAQHAKLLRTSRERRAALGSEAPRERRSALDLIGDGDRLRSGGNLPHAAIAYLRAHHADASDPTPLRRIAYLALEREPAKAAQLFVELLEREPNAPDLQLGLAVARLARGEHEAALVAALSARNLAPGDALALEIVGLVHDQLGLHEEAQLAYRAAVAAPGAAASAFNNLGVSLLLAGEYEPAVRNFEAALAKGSGDPAIRNNLGLALGLAGHTQRAFAHFQAVGSRGDALNNLGLVFFLSGDREAARSAWAQALLANDTDEARVLHNLALVQGDPK